MDAEPSPSSSLMIRALTVESLLAQFETQDRPTAIHLSLVQLRDQANVMEVVIWELAHLAHSEAIWSKVRDDKERPFQSEEEYFEFCFSLTSKRSAYKRMMIGRALASLPPAERDQARTEFAQLGIAKAAIVAPAVEDLADASVPPGEIVTGLRAWVEQARSGGAHGRPMLEEELQRAVSSHRGVKSRGLPVPLPAPGKLTSALDEGGGSNGFESWLIERFGDLNEREVLEDLFKVGRRYCETQNVRTILIRAAQEALSQWTPVLHVPQPPKKEDPHVDEGTPRGSA